MEKSNHNSPGNSHKCSQRRAATRRREWRAGMEREHRVPTCRSCCLSAASRAASACAFRSSRSLFRRYLHDSARTTQHAQLETASCLGQPQLWRLRDFLLVGHGFHGLVCARRPQAATRVSSGDGMPMSGARGRSNEGLRLQSTVARTVGLVALRLPGGEIVVLIAGERARVEVLHEDFEVLKARNTSTNQPLQPLHCKRASRAQQHRGRAV